MAVAAHSLPSGSLYSPETSTYVNSLVKSAFTCATYSIGYSQAKQGKLRTAYRSAVPTARLFHSAVGWTIYPPG